MRVPGHAAVHVTSWCINSASLGAPPGGKLFIFGGLK